ncbi:alanyl-tRNA editing protein [Amaricoccus tamworthensis]|uniref:alanyl-tRNA editing protein n=1 Tax=Amaricoccus tamworthensis TaxID=57002 RepID=UPI003C7AF6F2
MVDCLYRDDAYATECDAVVTEVVDGQGFELDRTVFYATSGGQAGDTGTCQRADGTEVAITGTIHPERDRARTLHQVAEGTALPEVGERVRVVLDFDRRLRLMRMHTALHLLSVVFPFGVTGGTITPDKGRLDFDMPDAPEDLEGAAARLNDMITADHPVTDEWISDGEMAARPEMVKTMSVKPPTGQGRVRLVRIGAGDQPVDLQPCGGTHVRTTAEIGPVRIGKVEKKGRNNRRINLHFVE